MQKKSEEKEGINGLDQLLLHRLRLGACVLLSQADLVSFSKLRDALEATDGNLGAQLRKLEEAQYIAFKKEFMDRKPVTWYSLTDKGRAALKRHFDALSNMMDDADY